MQRNHLIRILIMVACCLPCIHSFAQFNVDTALTIDTVSTMDTVLTMDTVEVTTLRKNSRHGVFSTFSNTLLNRTVFSLNENGNNTQTGAHNFPVCLSVQNRYSLVRMDSLYLKGTAMDTGKINMIFRIFNNDTLYSYSRPGRIIRSHHTNVIVFEKELYFPKGLSYCSFEFEVKENIPFRFFCNRKIKGFWYNYNSVTGEFRILNMDESGPQTGSPQMKLFYTVIQ